MFYRVYLVFFFNFLIFFYDLNLYGQTAKGSQCFDDFAAPLGALGFFSPDGRFFYHMAQMEKVRSTHPDAPLLFHFRLLSIELESLQLQTVMSLKMPKIDAAVFYGYPLHGISAINFDESARDCLNGVGTYAAISMPKNESKIKTIKEKGVFSFINSPEQMLVFESIKRNLVEIDFDLMQTRFQILSVYPEEVPLYFDALKRHLYTFKRQTKTSTRGLIAYDGGNKAAARLEFPRGDRLLYQGKLFGSMQTNAIENKLTLLKLEKWSGKGAAEKFSIVLPGIFSVKDAAVQMDFKKNFAVVYGFSQKERKKWKKLFIYDLISGQELGHFSQDEKIYPKNVYLSPDGSSVIVEISRISDEQTLFYAVFVESSKNWKKVAIPKMLPDQENKTDKK